MRTFLAAVQFLTIVPVRSASVTPGRAALFFPLVGAILGGLGAGLWRLSGETSPPPIVSLLVIVFWAATTGGLHEDGLADVADALRAGRSRERMMAILKDSRIGAFGALAVTLSVLLRWQALQSLATARPFEAIVASQAVPRAAMVALAWCSRPVGAGLGFALSSTLTTPVALAAMAQGIAAALWCGLRPGFAILVGAYLIVRLARTWFYARLGGVNGDGLGAAGQMVEIFVLVLFTCQRCSW